MSAVEKSPSGTNTFQHQQLKHTHSTTVWWLSSFSHTNVTHTNVIHILTVKLFTQQVVQEDGTWQLKWTCCVIRVDLGASVCWWMLTECVDDTDVVRWRLKSTPKSKVWKLCAGVLFQLPSDRFVVFPFLFSLDCVQHCRFIVALSCDCWHWSHNCGLHNALHHYIRQDKIR